MLSLDGLVKVDFCRILLCFVKLGRPGDSFLDLSNEFVWSAQSFVLSRTSVQPYICALGLFLQIVVIPKT